MNNKSTLYSIGHGQKNFNEFIDELQSYNIKYLIDVRSTPYSKWAPDYNRGTIQLLLKRYNINYGYMGDCIGGRPLREECYDNEGFFDYKKMAEQDTFKRGLDRLIAANERGYLVAIMCSESDPSECHRSKLIGRELYFDHNIEMHHIISPNRIISQLDIMTKLVSENGGIWPNGDLFNPNPLPPFFKSRKSYKQEEQFDDNTNEFQYDQHFYDWSL